jgi:dTDP-4-amino-4,6-dideoxygalactose transaminase
LKVVSLTVRDAFNDDTIKVPFFSQEISNEDKETVISALSSPLLTDGPILQKFESNFKTFAGSKYSVGVSNATAALHLSLKALGIGKNHEVLIPDMTFVATASAVLLAGATPVLVDVDDNDLNISTKSIENSLTSRTKAVIPVHFAGRSCNMKMVMEIARKNNLKVIEDCAHAIGAKYGRKHVGTFGDAGCFSFYPTKNITTIEGGMIITKSKTIADHIKTARNHGITKSLTQRYSHGRPWDYDVTEPGYNYRLDEIRAALGISQLKRIHTLNQIRRKACEYYSSKLGMIKGIKTPLLGKMDAYHLYMIRIKNEYGIKRDKLFEKLLKDGIRTSVHYKPLHEFTVFKKRAKIYDILDNSKQAYKEIISLPLYTRISREQQDKVITAITRQ